MLGGFGTECVVKMMRYTIMTAICTDVGSHVWQRTCYLVRALVVLLLVVAGARGQAKAEHRRKPIASDQG